MKLTKGKIKNTDEVGSEILSVTDVVPYKRITEEGYLVDRFDEYQAFLRVKTHDLMHIYEDELNRMKKQLTSLSSIYMEPFKIVSMSYLTDTSAQQDYWKDCLEKRRAAAVKSDNFAASRMKLSLVADQIRYSSWVENSLLELTFFIIVYGRTKADLGQHMAEMIKLGGDEFALTHVKDPDALTMIVQNMTNPNTPLNAEKNKRR